MKALIHPLLTRLFLFGVLLMIPFCQSLAQKQVAFIYHGKVVARYTIGSRFNLKLKNGTKKEGIIVELNEFNLRTDNDTINFQSIAKLARADHHGVRVNAGLGGLLFVGGLGYIAIDQLNAALGYNKGGWDSGDQLALALAGVGAAMLFIKPRYTTLRPGTTIRTIDYRSPFYLSPY